MNGTGIPNANVVPMENLSLTNCLIGFFFVKCENRYFSPVLVSKFSVRVLFLFMVCTSLSKPVMLFCQQYKVFSEEQISLRQRSIDGCKVFLFFTFTSSVSFRRLLPSA
jgi:hypothetical protein